MFITKSNFENEKINGNANKEQITKSLTDGQRTNRTNKKDQIHTLATTFILLHKQLKKRTINI